MQIYTIDQLETLDHRIDLPADDQQFANPFYTGDQHGLNWETYASDDEPLSDVEPDLDAHAYDDWRLTDATYDEELHYAGHPVTHDRIVY